MILPIVAYGDPILRRQAKVLEPGTDLQEIVAVMLATMAQADGAGLAAPQVGHSIRLIVADFNPNAQSDVFKRVYINPMLHIEADEEISYREEGCLSIPDVYINVPRKKRVMIDFYDINWERKQEELVGIQARIVQHEYDHLEGKLHIDYAGPLKRRLLQRKLTDISQGKVHTDYPMRLANKITHPFAVAK
ncbi:MAG: peptide deformylase [Burkholderiales bacterium]